MSGKESEAPSQNLAELRHAPLDPKRTGVLVIDMQNMECQPERLGEAERIKKQPFFERLREVVIPNQVRLLDAARANGIEVLFTTIESMTLDGRDRSLDYKISELHAAKGSHEAQVIDELKRGENEIQIPKTSSSVFNSTNINYVLRNIGVDHLVVCGIVTEQCVESAVRDAADLGYLVTMVEDGCATYDQAIHDDCIRRMDGHYGRVLPTSAVIAELRGDGERGAIGAHRT